LFVIVIVYRQGFLGECGLRGGYYELLGFSDHVKAELLKLASISLCSNTIGQIAVGLMVNPPQPGDTSYENFSGEKDTVLSSLRRRAMRMTEALNSLEGITCTTVEGAIYAFPRIFLPGMATGCIVAIFVVTQSYTIYAV
jgi:alanine transaminase